MNEFRDKGEAPSLPRELREFLWAPPESFLAIPPEETPFDRCPVVVLPVPYESTVSYMGGTKFGPRGLIHASRFLELYDHELDFEPYQIGIHTLPELLLPDSGPEPALSTLQRAVSELIDAGKFVIMIGGEHSVSGPAILAHADRHTDSRLSVLQLDAHCDLREEYEGTPYSHACVMHRVHRLVNLVSVGVRSLTTEERRLIEECDITVIFGHELRRDGWIERVIESLGETVYITLDVDFFDPSLVPATGTPEPGGGDWYSTIDLLQRVFQERNVVGCDVVELAPIPGLVAPDFLAAKLVYKLVALYARRHGY